MTDINTLLQQEPSADSADDVMEWFEELQNKIDRGDMMIGLISSEELDIVPEALKFAAKGGIKEAWMSLAFWLMDEEDDKGADKALMEAVENNITDAMLLIAEHRWFLRKDNCTDQEKKEAYELLNKYNDEKKDDSEGIYLKGLITCGGFGTKEDPIAAVELQKKAAEMDNSRALFELYVHYSTGLGVDIDNDKALKYNIDAAELGHPRALYNMGAFYATGKLVEKDITKAVEFYTDAVDEGSGLAAATLAVMYAIGEDIDKDIEKAEDLFDEAEYLGFDTEKYRHMAGLDN